MAFNCCHCSLLLHYCSLGLCCCICRYEQLAHLPRQVFQGTKACVCRPEHEHGHDSVRCKCVLDVHCQAVSGPPTEVIFKFPPRLSFALAPNLAIV